MPYNPGISYTGSSDLGAGIRQGTSHLKEALMWLMQSSDDTKTLRKQLDTVDPGAKEEHAQMSQAELKGKIQGMHALDQAKQSALQQQLAQQNLTRGAGEMASETAMSNAMAQAMPPVTNTTSDLQGNPATGGNPFTVNVASQGQMQPGALVKAIAQNPAAINSPAGRQALNDWMKTASATQRGAPQFMQGPDGTTWAFNQFTGQFEPSPVDKIKATAAAKAANKTPDRVPGDGPTTSKDGKFYFDQHLQTWKPLAAKKSNSLFGDPDGSAAPSVNYTWDNGELKRAQ